jgi:hypothetical protein
MRTFRLPAPAPGLGLGLAALLALPLPAQAFEVCMEGGPWLAFYLQELEKGHFSRVLDLTTPLPGQSRAALRAALEQALTEGRLDAGAMARLTIEGECTSQDKDIDRMAALHQLNPDTIVGYRLGRAFVVLTIVGPPDWFNFVGADLEGL